jgi:hypothetical protein
MTFAQRMNAADASHFSATNDYRNTAKIKKQLLSRMLGSAPRAGRGTPPSPFQLS